MNLCDACEWCATCLKRGECIPVNQIPPVRLPPSPAPAPAALKFPAIDPNLLPTKETTA
jgi:hypothetical protein